ncbi:ImmA/IrrE family metallo-endopeptidase [Paenibacillus sp. VCA1]|uniref:ImmA/IrrE family metallo-endopeptidase n=1 Tax=Paenibacillus sp. VCA1 TaxID=3039148 RepID=UPI002871E4F3|nr:ImmA/IrrE family metallo-endopeptidase [Paenibacillus sp. VCA1]MDR9857836.1 ImmA/IrrE family metallo-endopeptidase [Paenibacillus sp. VCA1]
MRYPYYAETILEEFISELYINNGIVEAKDLEIPIIADTFNIEVFFDNCISCSDNEKRVIFIDKRLKEHEQRTVFFHELCHVLRHSGDQRSLPQLFTQGQELEADHFMMYAAVPFFMVKKLPIPNRRGEAIKYISKKFHVSIEFAEKRLNQIQRRDLQGKMDRSFIEQQELFRGEHEVFTEGIQLYAYYDFNSDITGPTQLILEASSDAMDSQITYFFDPNGPFERLEIEDFYGYKCTQLKEQDLIYKNGKIGVNFAVLNLIYGRSAKRFVIQMRDVENVVCF